MAASSAAELPPPPGPKCYTLAGLEEAERVALAKLRERVTECAASATTATPHRAAQVLADLLQATPEPLIYLPNEEPSSSSSSSSTTTSTEGESTTTTTITTTFGRLPDTKLLQFLVARQFQVEAAFEMLVAAMEWRQERQPERLLQAEVAAGLVENQRMKAAWWPHRDVYGRPVCLGWASRHLKHFPSLEEKINHALWCLEGAPCLQKEGAASFFVVLADLSGLGWDNVDYAFFQEMINVMQNFYPERLGAFYVCNAGWIFTAIWAVVKPWLDKRTAQKIIVNPSTADLLKLLPRDQLPRSFGGSADESAFGKELPPNAPKPPKK